MNRPTIRQLEYVVAVADHRHFGRAAKACFVTQPGLSAQIQQVEELLGLQIFERNRRGVIVTPVGRELVDRAQRILLEVDAWIETARISGKPLTGDLRVGVIPTIGPYLLPQVLPRVRRKYKALRLRLREDTTARLLDGLRTGRLDLAIVALEADLGDMETLALFQDDFHAVMPADHPLARKRKLRETDLAGESVLLLDDGH